MTALICPGYFLVICYSFQGILLNAIKVDSRVNTQNTNSISQSTHCREISEEYFIWQVQER